MLKVLCVVSSKFCKFCVTENRLQVRSPRRNSKKGMEDDDCVFVAQASHGVPLTAQGVLRIARRASAARTRRVRGRSRETQLLTVVSVSPERIVVDDSGPTSATYDGGAGEEDAPSANMSWR